MLVQAVLLGLPFAFKTRTTSEKLAVTGIRKLLCPLPRGATDLPQEFGPILDRGGRMRFTFSLLFVAAAALTLANPAVMRVRSLHFNLLPEKLDVEADVRAQAKAFGMSGMPPETVALNEKNFRETSEFRAKGAVLDGEVRFASDGVWYESETIAPLMKSPTRVIPYFQKYDGQNTYLRTTGVSQVLKGDRRGLYSTLGDAIFLYGALPESVQKISSASKNGTIIETYEGDLGAIGRQRLRLVRKNGLPVSAVSVQYLGDKEATLATYSIRQDVLLVDRSEK